MWKKGGFIEASPHRKCSLLNAKEEDIYQTRHMREFLDLYKTLHMATPAISEVLAPLEDQVAGALPGDKFQWTHKASQSFRESKDNLEKVSTLYLPSPEDQLMIKPDGSKMTPGVGHVIYAVKNGQLRPVRYHSVKLKEDFKKWSPCEIEALAIAVAINANYDLLRESKKTVLICPDNKPMAEAVELIKKGGWSSSSRMNRLISNVNKIPITVKHTSSKFN